MRLRVLLALTAVAAAPPPGASSCSGCHGTAPVPVLAGRDQAATVAALDEFRAGTRKATVMDRIAKGFSHDELAAIAAWWAGQK